MKERELLIRSVVSLMLAMVKLVLSVNRHRAALASVGLKVRKIRGKELLRWQCSWLIIQ